MKTKEELFDEAYSKAEEFVNKLSFEFYWDFAGVDKDLLRESMTLSFVEGYMKGLNRGENI